MLKVKRISVSNGASVRMSYYYKKVNSFLYMYKHCSGLMNSCLAVQKYMYVHRILQLNRWYSSKHQISQEKVNIRKMPTRKCHINYAHTTILTVGKKCHFQVKNYSFWIFIQLQLKIDNYIYYLNLSFTQCYKHCVHSVFFLRLQDGSHKLKHYVSTVLMCKLVIIICCDQHKQIA